MKLNTVEPMTIIQYLALINEVSYVNVCKAVGITPQQFSDWTKKRRPVPKERLSSLAAYFEIDEKLLVDDKNYLKALTPEERVDIQILFLEKKLEVVDASEKEVYNEKLATLYNEKFYYSLIGRFENIIRQSNEDTHRICELFLEHLEQGNLSLLEEMLNRKEEKK